MATTYRITSCKTNETMTGSAVDAIMRAVAIDMQYMPAGGTDVWSVDADGVVARVATVQAGADTQQAGGLVVELADEDVDLSGMEQREARAAIRAALERAEAALDALIDAPVDALIDAPVSDEAARRLLGHVYGTTVETITDDQIRALRREAKAAGDDLMADLCARVLEHGREIDDGIPLADIVEAIRGAEAQV